MEHSQEPVTEKPSAPDAAYGSPPPSRETTPHANAQTVQSSSREPSPLVHEIPSNSQSGSQSRESSPLFNGQSAQVQPENQGQHGQQSAQGQPENEEQHDQQSASGQESSSGTPQAEPPIPDKPPTHLGKSRMVSGFNYYCTKGSWFSVKEGKRVGWEAVSAAWTEFRNTPAALSAWREYEAGGGVSLDQAKASSGNGSSEALGNSGVTTDGSGEASSPESRKRKRNVNTGGGASLDITDGGASTDNADSGLNNTGGSASPDNTGGSASSDNAGSAASPDNTGGGANRPALPAANKVDESDPDELATRYVNYLREACSNAKSSEEQLALSDAAEAIKEKVPAGWSKDYLSDLARLRKGLYQFGRPFYVSNPERWAESSPEVPKKIEVVAHWLLPKGVWVSAGADPATPHVRKQYMVKRSQVPEGVLKQFMTPEGNERKLTPERAETLNDIDKDDITIIMAASFKQELLNRFPITYAIVDIGKGFPVVFSRSVIGGKMGIGGFTRDYNDYREMCGQGPINPVPAKKETRRK